MISNYVSIQQYLAVITLESCEKLESKNSSNKSEYGSELFEIPRFTSSIDSRLLIIGQWKTTVSFVDVNHEILSI